MPRSVEGFWQNINDFINYSEVADKRNLPLRPIDSLTDSCSNNEH